MTRKIFSVSTSFTLLLTLAFSQFAFANGAPFVLLGSHKRAITKTQLESLESAHVKASTSANRKAIILPGDSIDLIIRTGPESDMLSYRIQGIRNPTLVVRAGSTMHILFVNVDDDMFHDIRMGDVKPPDTVGTAGSARLPHSEEEDNYSAQELTIKVGEAGKYPYFCSYKTHAANGMRGWIIVAKADATADEMKHLAMGTSGASGTMGIEGVGGVEDGLTDVNNTAPISQQGSANNSIAELHLAKN